MLGRVKEAVSDAAETLRRAFSGLAVVEAPPEPFRPHSHGAAGFGAAARSGFEALPAAPREMPLLRNAGQSHALEPFRGELQMEEGWARWAAGARVLRMMPLEPGRAAQVAVPALPRRPAVAGQVEAPRRPAARRVHEPLGRPGAGRLDPALPGGTARPGLAAMLTLPVPVQGQDVQRLPKGLWMRYSLQLIRATGENVRNLEVLGLFQVPRKGVASLAHDARRRRIYLRLEAAAVSAPRGPFVLARRRDDGTIVSAFVEDP